MKTVQTICSALLTSCALALACGNALAAEQAARQRVVSYADLNLDNPAGTATLYRRIHGAARAVCNNSDLLPALRAANRECVRKAIDDAVAQVGDYNLSALHMEKKNKSGPKIAARR